MKSSTLQTVANTPPLPPPHLSHHVQMYVHFTSTSHPPDIIHIFQAFPIFTTPLESKTTTTTTTTTAAAAVPPPPPPPPTTTTTTKTTTTKQGRPKYEAIKAPSQHSILV